MFNLSVILGLIYILFATFVFGSIMILKYFPKSKISEWIRRHIITDEDLEPLKGNDPE